MKKTRRLLRTKIRNNKVLKESKLRRRYLQKYLKRSIKKRKKGEKRTVYRLVTKLKDVELNAKIKSRKIASKAALKRIQ